LFVGYLDDSLFAPEYVITVIGVFITNSGFKNSSCDIWPEGIG
jgi:hypothetical protein